MPLESKSLDIDDVVVVVKVPTEERRWLLVIEEDDKSRATTLGYVNRFFSVRIVYVHVRTNIYIWTGDETLAVEKLYERRQGRK